MRVNFEGELPVGSGAKDMILHLIGRYSAAGGSGYTVEFAGPAISALSVEARMTLCNMAVEFSAFTGIIAPDDKTIEFSRGRNYGPTGEQWELAVEHWKTLYSDPDASFDQEISIDSSEIRPAVTWGTSPQHMIAIDGIVPNPDDEPEAEKRNAMIRALEYMGLSPGTSMSDIPVDAAFIGSCTNVRISDQGLAAERLGSGHINPSL
jgi:3-isopropylmalate/(R)-2-methylmalate dehydratase large subunit